MIWTVRHVLLLLFAATFALTSLRAQAQQPNELVPYSSPGYGYESVVPDGWSDLGQGIFARQSDAEDPTLLAQQSAPLPAADVLASLLPQLGLTEAPESVGTHQGET